MALESTNIQDREGAALYILHTGSILEGQQLEHLASEVAAQTDHQIQLLDVSTEDGEKVRDFYDIAVGDLPTIMIVRDDDTITNIWRQNQLPTADILVSSLRQVSA